MAKTLISTIDSHMHWFICKIHTANILLISHRVVVVVVLFLDFCNPLFHCFKPRLKKVLIWLKTPLLHSFLLPDYIVNRNETTLYYSFSLSYSFSR